ncbi:hypothetical protein SAMD00023353_1100970 [Rosellinia necatrix]|uniref:Uncharacterized protein n=1 Tax=Rosellinia necatrix TaxID=77044 RepID=A0A1S7UMJ5_ROSNE|nr:hypothetical protein SAMD00023353_1100970 [Rosellinia necatrix]
MTMNGDLGHGTWDMANTRHKTVQAVPVRALAPSGSLIRAFPRILARGVPSPVTLSTSTTKRPGFDGPVIDTGERAEE